MVLDKWPFETDQNRIFINFNLLLSVIHSIDEFSDTQQILSPKLYMMWVGFAHYSYLSLELSIRNFVYFLNLNNHLSRGFSSENNVESVSLLTDFVQCLTFKVIMKSHVLCKIIYGSLIEHLEQLYPMEKFEKILSLMYNKNIDKR